MARSPCLDDRALMASLIAPKLPARGTWTSVRLFSRGCARSGNSCRHCDSVRGHPAGTIDPAFEPPVLSPGAISPYALRRHWDFGWGTTRPARDVLLSVGSLQVHPAYASARTTDFRRAMRWPAFGYFSTIFWPSKLTVRLPILASASSPVPLTSTAGPRQTLPPKVVT